MKFCCAHFIPHEKFCSSPKLRQKSTDNGEKHAEQKNVCNPLFLTVKLHVANAEMLWNVVYVKTQPAPLGLIFCQMKKKFCEFIYIRSHFKISSSVVKLLQCRKFKPL